MNPTFRSPAVPRRSRKRVRGDKEVRHRQGEPLVQYGVREMQSLTVGFKIQKRKNPASTFLGRPEKLARKSEQPQT